MASGNFPHFPRYRYESVPIHKLALVLLKWSVDRVLLRHERNLPHKRNCSPWSSGASSNEIHPCPDDSWKRNALGRNSTSHPWGFTRELFARCSERFWRSTLLRFALASIVILAGVLIGHSAIQTVSEMTESRQQRICQIDPTLCNSKWFHIHPTFTKKFSNAKIFNPCPLLDRISGSTPKDLHSVVLSGVGLRFFLEQHGIQSRGLPTWSNLTRSHNLQQRGSDFAPFLLVRGRQAVSKNEDSPNLQKYPDER